MRRVHAAHLRRWIGLIDRWRVDHIAQAAAFSPQRLNENLTVR